MKRLCSNSVLWEGGTEEGCQTKTVRRGVDRPAHLPDSSRVTQPLFRTIARRLVLHFCIGSAEFSVQVCFRMYLVMHKLSAAIVGYRSAHPGFGVCVRLRVYFISLAARLESMLNLLA